MFSTVAGGNTYVNVKKVVVVKGYITLRGVRLVPSGRGHQVGFKQFSRHLVSSRVTGKG